MTGYYAPIDRYDGLGEPLQAPHTYPAGWFILALIAALLFLTWVPVLVFAAIGFLILGVLKVLGIRATGSGDES